LPGSPPTSPIFGVPRYADSDAATFSSQVNAITDTFDSKAVLNTDVRLTNTRTPTPGSVVAASFAAGAVTPAAIAPASITEACMAPGSIGSTEIIDGTIQGADVAAAAIGTTQLAAGAVQTLQIGDGQVTIAKLGPAAGQAISQPGDLILSAAATRAGAVLCDGSAYSRTAPTYAALFAAIGTGYGAGDGSTTFNVPDYRGTALVGVGARPGGSTWGLGQKYGEETHALSVAEMPGHAHGVSDPAHAHSVYDPGHSHGISIANAAFPYRYVAGMAAAAWGNLSAAGGSLQFAAGSGGNNITSSDLNHGHTASAAAVATGIGIYAAATGISIQSAGSSYAHNNFQPSCGVNIFIKL